MNGEAKLEPVSGVHPLYQSGTESLLEAQVASFWRFIELRQEAWLHRQAGGERSTFAGDEVIRTSWFPNVYRAEDTGSRYAVDQLGCRETREVIWGAVAYRLLNRQATFEAFGRIPYRGDGPEWVEFIAARYARRESVTSGRHLTPSRVMYLEALRQAWSWWAVSWPARGEEMYWALRKLRGVGPFLAWQVYADLVSMKRVLWNPDFALPGEGSAYAIKMLLGERTAAEYSHPSHKPGVSQVGIITRERPTVKEQRAMAWVVLALRDMQGDYNFHRTKGQEMTVIDVEHALCEWQRWSVAWARR